MEMVASYIAPYFVVATASAVVGMAIWIALSLLGSTIRSITSSFVS